MSRKEPLVAGVDGSRYGWIAAVGPVSGDELWLWPARRLSDLVDAAPRVRRWAIDMPIGLASDGQRECDRLARQRLGPNRAASVFTTPPDAALDQNDYGRACGVAERLMGKRFSKQAWNLVPKIREVRRLLCQRDPLRSKLFETHPELCFARLNAGTGLMQAKKAVEGQATRRRLLETVIAPDTLQRVESCGANLSQCGIDDVLDAVACWTAARRVLTKQAESLPEKPPTDAIGLPIAIRW